jgi:hypothetical protein
LRKGRVQVGYQPIFFGIKRRRSCVRHMTQPTLASAPYGLTRLVLPPLYPFEM